MRDLSAPYHSRREGAPLTENASPRTLRLAEPLKLVYAVSNRNARFALGSLGGRFVLLCVVGDADHAGARAAMQAFPCDRADETQRVCALFCTTSGDDAAIAAISRARLVFADAEAARACGLIDPRQPEGRWILLDPSLRALAFWPLTESQRAIAALASTPNPDQHAGAPINAPVLIAPRIFEPNFCRAIIDYYDRHGGQASGVTQANETGKTYVRLDDTFKRRADCLIDDETLRNEILQRIYWRLAPEIEKAFMWRPTRMERYLVACYDAELGGFFRAHRDNTTPGTAHRRFAVTINLNAEDYDGGDLRFPEFGSRAYRAPTGGAVVFSCALLHEALQVTRGKRYAFLPFLYDEEAARIRQANNEFLDESIQPYQEN
jgi:predicted 2-oxoglutarate/Fe(II)-dependent dioxygenase YbiX